VPRGDLRDNRLPFAIVGAIWLMLALGYNFSVAVGVRLIAVAGFAAETGVVMHDYSTKPSRSREVVEVERSRRG